MPMKEPFVCASASIVTTDPSRCRTWAFNVRIQQDVNVVSASATIQSIQRDGQLIPVLVRRLHGNPDFDIEVICGARRPFVARHLDISLQVSIRELTDRQATVAVQTDSSLRKRRSAYERWLATLLKQGISITGRDGPVARSYPTQLTKMLKYLELPTVVIGALLSIHDIVESWAVELHKACLDERQGLLTARARALEKRPPRPPAELVYETLLAPTSHDAHREKRAASRVVRCAAGRPLLRFERQRKEVALRIPIALVNPRIEEAVTEPVVAVLTRGIPDGHTASAA